MTRQYLQRGVMCVLLVSLIAYPAGAISSTTSESNENLRADTKKMVSAWGIEFTLTYYPNNSLQVYVRNPTNETISSGFVTTIDRFDLAREHFELEPKDQETWTFNITPGIDAIRDKHQLIVSTAGAAVRFNFTWRVDITDTGQVPIPYIRNVSVGNGFIDGQPSTVANVTIVNPSLRIYGLRLMASTEGTNGSFYAPVVYPDETKVVTVELLEEQGTPVAGEVRIYKGNISTRQGAIDQVEFVGRADEQTHVWNVSYHPIEPPWVSNNYVYENESVETSADEELTDVIGPLRQYRSEAIALFGVLVLLLVGKWLR